MKNKFLTLALIACLVPLASGCWSMRHTVGNGGSGASEVSERQWFALWGLVPLGNVDGGDLAGDAQDYTVETEQNVLDIVINLLTGWVTIYSRTVTVTR